jgi:multidrug efflux pump subunit AcrA (membrane-fusion protein)
VVNGARVERRAVTVGIDAGSGDEVIVLSGVGAGDKVVLEGPADLADGDEVEVREK